MKKGLCIVLSFGVLFLGYCFFDSLIRRNENYPDVGLEKDDLKEVRKMKMRINGLDFIVTLVDNETVKEFLRLLPLEIMMNELNGNEKYYYLDEPLPNHPLKYHNIEVGDIMLFNDNCLVIFYESFVSNYAYTRIGKIDDISLLKQAVGQGTVPISFTQV